MNSNLQHQHGLTDFWKEPWTASTWGTWSSQGPASRGLEPSSSWMYTSYAPNHAGNNDESDADIDFSHGSYSSSADSSLSTIGSSVGNSIARSIGSCIGDTMTTMSTSRSATNALSHNIFVSLRNPMMAQDTSAEPILGSIATQQQRLQQQQQKQVPSYCNINTNTGNNNNDTTRILNRSDSTYLHQHTHEQHHQHTSTLPVAPMTPPGLSPPRCGPVSGRPPLAAPVSAPIAISRGPGVVARPRRSSSVTSMDSESSSLSTAGSVGSVGSISSVGSSADLSASSTGMSAFQIGGYRTVELLPTALQRQTLQKWFGVVRWTHNRAVDALRADPALTATSLRAAVAEAEADHEWAAAVPLAIRDATVAQLVGALHLAQRSAEVAAAATGESVAVEPIGAAAVNTALKYRTRKDRLEHVVLRADGFQFGIPYPESFGYAPLASSAPIPDRLRNDAILVRSTERFYLCVPDASSSSSLERVDSISSLGGNNYF